ncbi:hypothetical protein ACG7TL_007085 [Trametes sanguinea]
MARILWKFINLSRRQALYHGLYGNGQALAGFFFGKQAFLVRELTIPYPHPDLARFLQNPPPPGPSAKAGLLSLPEEILLLIIEESDVAPIDSICLAITCKKLLALSEKVLGDIRTAEYAPWAHCRIACILKQSDYQDAPDSLIPFAMKEEIRTALEKDGVEGHFASTAALNFTTYMPSDPQPMHDRYRHAFLSLLEPDQQLFLAATAATYPKRDDWVLCNTVKKEYVCAKPLSALLDPPYNSQASFEAHTIYLATALVTRFSWPSSPGYASGISDLVKDGRFGSWAGDRFCITTIEKEVAECPEYTDVTREAIEDIVTIWRVLRKIDMSARIPKVVLDPYVT